MRRGPLTVTWLPPAAGDTSPCRAGFAVGRQAGGAVLRNRVKRRLRAALRSLAADGRLPGGALLVGAGPTVADLPWSELLSLVDATVSEVQA